jgi:hypothetical protein
MVDSTWCYSTATSSKVQAESSQVGMVGKIGMTFLWHASTCAVSQLSVAEVASGGRLDWTKPAPTLTPTCKPPIAHDDSYLVQLSTSHDYYLMHAPVSREKRHGSSRARRVDSLP